MALIILYVLIYFLPTIIAAGTNKRAGCAIMVLNTLAGWTGLGWLISLVWALIPDTPVNKG